MIVIKIMERDMIVTTTARVTSGSVNLPVKFHFKGDEWDDLVKTAVFIGSGEERDVALITDECAVPADVLAEAGGDLKIGVYGRLANGATVIPTIWGRVQYIYEGTEMSEPSPHDPEPDWTAQVQQAAATALTKATAVEEAAARGDFDGVSPEVTISSATHGHSVTITDRDHPEGQSFDVLDGASAYEQAVAGGYEGTEAQFNAELAAFKDLSEQAASSATAAASSATAAAGSATAAAGSATDAATSASSAESASDRAERYMSSASSSSSSAFSSAGRASNFSSSAYHSAETAEEQATAAAASAAGASDSADSAASSATAASGSATAAANSATAAAASATAAGNAQTAAEAAQTAAVAAKTATETARDTAISTLQTEGAAQKTAIQQKGAEVIASIPSDYTELSDEVDDLKSAFDADLFADRYVKYNSLTSYGFSANANRPSFSRYGNRFTFNGTINTAYWFVKLSEEGSTNTTTGINAAKAWPKPVEYKTGHIYKACFTLLSGSYSGSPLISLFGSDNSRVNIGIGEEITFTPGPIFSNVVYVGVNGASFDNAVFSFTIEDITEEGLTTYDKSVVGAINELNENTKGLAYSWWINNTATDSYGTLYFGYISDKSMVGVGCRYADGTIKRHDLFASEDNDDHNAPSVIIIPIEDQEHVCVIGSTGHNTDNKINVFVADMPNTIDCTFTNKSHTITAPTGYQYQCSYAQAYYDSANNAIINFFRLKQVNTSDSTFHMVWMCAKSTDNGSTWSIYRVFTITEDGVLFYMFSANTTSSHIMRMILQVNTTYAQYKPLKAGLINTKSGNIFDNTMTNIQKPMTLVPDGGLVYDTSVTIANYDDFTTMVEIDGDKRLRILDVFTTAASSNKACFLYAKSVESSTTYRDLVHWDLYRSYNGSTVKVGELGMPFFFGSLYVTGASFIGDVDHVVYCKNDSTYQDYLHSMHLVALENNAVTSDSIIKRAARTLARPKRYDNGNIMYLIGKYREGAGTKYLTWHFSIGFMDSI